MNFPRRVQLVILGYGFLAYGVQPNLVNAQIVHSDIRFAYSDGQVVVETNVATGEFPVDGFFRQFETNPGFASENDVGFGILPGDTIVYNVLDDLLYWNGSDFVTPPINTQVRIDNNGSPDTIVHGSSGMQQGNFTPLAHGVGQADNRGDLHAHVDFFLEPNDASPPPELGVYGLKLSLSTSAVDIAESDPFYVAFNFGLANQAFVDAVHQYALLLTPSLNGDFDDDGDVDGQDFLDWQRGELSNPPRGIALQAWRKNYGSHNNMLTSDIVTVPELTTNLLIAIYSAWGMLFRHPVRSRFASGN